MKTQSAILIVVITVLAVVAGTAALALGFFTITDRVVGYGGINFETIDQGQLSGITENRTYVIRTQSLWENLLNDSQISNLPSVDFNQHTVIAAFIGEKPTGGYATEINEIREETDRIVVFVHEVKPGQECFVTQALTQPYHIVKIPKTDKTVVFDIQEKLMPC